MADNGKMFKVVMYLVGVLVSLLLTAMIFLGRNVIANDEKSRTRDTVIIEKSNTHIAKLREDMNGHLSTIKDNISQQRVIQAQILTELKYIRNGND